MKPDASQIQRQEILRKAGIDPKNQQIAVHTIHQLQNMLVQKADETSLGYLRVWLPELKALLPSAYQEWLHAHGCVFQIVAHTRDKITGNSRLVYCLYRERDKDRDRPEIKRAFETNARIIPVLNGKGLFRLDFDHKEIDFPPDVRISKA